MSQETTTKNIAAEKNTRWQWQTFDELSLTEFHAIARARVNVFVVEQCCPYPELDGQDPQAHHLSVWNQTDQLLAYLRVLPAGGRFSEPSIGRVLTTTNARGQGLGRPLMAAGITHCRGLYPGSAIVVSAQHHLQAFYQSLGFASFSQMYLEDDIPHIDMRLAAVPG